MIEHYQLLELVDIVTPLAGMEYDEIKITLAWLVLQILLDQRRRPNPLDDLPIIDDY